MNLTEFKGLIVRNYHSAKIINKSRSERIFATKNFLIREHYEAVCKFCPPYYNEYGYSRKRLLNLIVKTLF